MGIALTILRTLGGILLGMGMSLLTEKVIKSLIVLGLEKLVKKTESDADDKVLQEAKKAWGVE